MGSDANDLYEVFLLLKVVEAGRAAGYGVHLAYDSPQPSTKNSKIPPPPPSCAFAGVLPICTQQRTL